VSEGIYIDIAHFFYSFDFDSISLLYDLTNSSDTILASDEAHNFHVRHLRSRSTKMEALATPYKRSRDASHHVRVNEDETPGNISPTDRV
jgi:hypothetical protein